MDPTVSTDFVLDFIAPQVARSSATVAILGEAFQKGVVGKVSKALKEIPALSVAFDASLSSSKPQIRPSCEWWQPEAGAAVRCAKAAELPAAALHSMLSLYAGGVEGSFSLDLPNADRFSLGGHVFSLSGRVEVSANHGDVSLASAHGSLSLRRSNSGWALVTLDDPRGATDYSEPAFIENNLYRGCYVQSWVEPIDNALDDFVVPWPPERFPDPTFAVMAARALDEALELLASLNPAYTSWISPLLRGVAASPQKLPGMMQSGSYTYHAGVFNCGFPRTRDFLSEVIVHEMSHQYFLLFTSVFPFVRPGENKMYYSSFKGRERPLDRLLLSFHAATNMALFWQDLIDQQGGLAERVRPFKFMLENATQMQGELMRAKELTDAGTQMFSKQCAMLAERGLAPAL